MDQYIFHECMHLLNTHAFMKYTPVHFEVQTHQASVNLFDYMIPWVVGKILFSKDSDPSHKWHFLRLVYPVYSLNEDRRNGQSPFDPTHITYQRWVTPLQVTCRVKSYMIFTTCRPLQNRVPILTGGTFGKSNASMPSS